MMVMKRARVGQLRLFDVPALPIGLTALQQAKAMVLLATLLKEALGGRIDTAVIRLQEAGDDEDHG
jgi:hypothetical protein